MLVFISKSVFFGPMTRKKLIDSYRYTQYNSVLFVHFVQQTSVNSDIDIGVWPFGKESVFDMRIE